MFYISTRGANWGGLGGSCLPPHPCDILPPHKESAARPKMQLLYPQIIIIYETVSFNDYFPYIYLLNKRFYFNCVVNCMILKIIWRVDKRGIRAYVHRWVLYYLIHITQEKFEYSNIRTLISRIPYLL